MKILIIKISSLGDVLHNLPVFWDIRKKFAEAQVDWIVEEGYINLLKPLMTTADFRGIDRIIPIRYRRWEKTLLRCRFIKTLKEFRAFKKELRQVQYDLIVETQGLMKTASVVYLTNKSSDCRILGLANKTEFSSYDPIARKFYTESIEVPFRSHAVDRSRWVASGAIKCSPPDKDKIPPVFYRDDYIKSLKEPKSELFKNELSIEKLGFDINKPYVLCLHSTARKAKRWDNNNWVIIGKEISEMELQVILPWGSKTEKLISIELAMEIPNAVVPEAFSLESAFYLVANAKLVLGVDTGLTHLAAILNCPTIELYCDSPRWKTEGYWSEQIVNLGDIKSPPTIDEVRQSIKKLLV